MAFTLELNKTTSVPLKHQIKAFKTSLLILKSISYFHEYIVKLIKPKLFKYFFLLEDFRLQVKMEATAQSSHLPLAPPPLLGVPKGRKLLCALPSALSSGATMEARLSQLHKYMRPEGSQLSKGRRELSKEDNKVVFREIFGRAPVVQILLQ